MRASHMNSDSSKEGETDGLGPYQHSTAQHSTATNLGKMIFLPVLISPYVNATSYIVPDKS